MLKFTTMYALIENQKVIGVFDPEHSINLTKNKVAIPINKLLLFYLDGGAIVVGELCREMVDFGIEGDWIVLTDECTYTLDEVDFWQPIGEWLSF